jgi:hypothetical protein
MVIDVMSGTDDDGVSGMTFSSREPISKIVAGVDGDDMLDENEAPD